MNLTDTPPPSEFPAGPIIAFAGGGTGGHIYPGIALADELQRRHPDARISFWGSGRDFEIKTLAQFPFRHVRQPILPPAQTVKNPFGYWRTYCNSMQEAKNEILSLRPNLIVGLGSYLSYPLIKAGIQQKVPFVLLEQNCIPGRATTFFASKAQLICTQFTETKSYLPSCKNVVRTGNPLRSIFYQQVFNNQSRHSEPVLLITGGSQGSQTLNEWTSKQIGHLASSLTGWRIRHQTGLNSSSIARLKELYHEFGIPAEVNSVYTNPQQMYEGVRLVLSRAGGTTLAELDWLNIPALLVPIKNSMRNHQQKNATAYLQTHAGELLTETQLITGSHAQERLKFWLDEAIRQPLQCFSSTEKPQFTATDLIANLCEKYLQLD